MGHQQKLGSYGKNRFFGPKSLIFMGVSKSVGTNITENHFGNLSALFFGHALDQVETIFRLFVPELQLFP